jgi:hypothetical protein
VSLALGYTLVPPFVTPAPELLDAHFAGIATRSSDPMVRWITSACRR